MPTLDRRRFLAVSAAAAAASLRTFAQDSTGQTVPLTLHAEEQLAQVPASFVGLSYETQQLADPNFFSPKNTGLIAQMRALTPQGVLRIGGNTSDVGWWKPTPESQQPAVPANVTLQTPKDEKPPMELSYAVTPEAVRNLRGFLDATGWTCLYGINLGTNTPERAAEEAEFVARTLGPKLEYFQLGNEPDGFPRRFRQRSAWNVEAYLKDWLAEAEAIVKRVPKARFGLPDVASNAAWFGPAAEKLASIENHPNIAAISHHYYFTGPPANPKANIPDLLKADPKVLRSAELAKEAAAKLNTRWRMTEGNTCFKGGKPGFSDVFAATLWAADYMLLLASLGYAGVNLHGGRGKEVADSLGGTLPGELLMADPRAPHPRPFYTPIQDQENGHYLAEPVYFGMLFAQQFAGATMVKLEFDPGAVNATAYAALKPNGKRLVAIINKDAAQPVRVNLPAGTSSACTATLTAPSLTSKDVSWNKVALQPEVVGKQERDTHLRCERHAPGAFTVPAASALLVEF